MWHANRNGATIDWISFRFFGGVRGLESLGVPRLLRACLYGGRASDFGAGEWGHRAGVAGGKARCAPRLCRRLGPWPKRLLEFACAWNYLVRGYILQTPPEGSCCRMMGFVGAETIASTGGNGCRSASCVRDGLTETGTRPARGISVCLPQLHCRNVHNLARRYRCSRCPQARGPGAFGGALQCAGAVR